MQEFDLFVIGGGSGGVRCARIAAGLGARVGIAESRHWGGTCVNVGCVPKKLMVQAAEYASHAQDAHGFGWRGAAPQAGWPTLMAAKNAEIARLNAIYVKLLQGAGVEIFEGHARFLDPHTLDINGEHIRAKKIVIATGGKPAAPGISGGELAIVSDDAFYLDDVPQRVVVVGGGYIGVEFAGIFRGFGAQVDLVYRQPLPLRGFDNDLRQSLAEALAAQGVLVHAGRSPNEIVLMPDNSRRVMLSDGTMIDTDLVFFATGRVPNLDRLGLNDAGVRLDPRGTVAVDSDFCTSQKHIFAIGDVCNRLNLTPVAIAEGHMLAERLFGDGTRDWSFAPVPTAVFSVPPVATCGLTEDEAAKLGPADIFVASFTPMRHTISGRVRRTLMKLVVDQASNRVLGAHMIGDDAAEMMQAIGVAMTAGATKRDFDRTIGIHPTSAEEWVTMRTRTRVAG